MSTQGQTRLQAIREVLTTQVRVLHSEMRMCKVGSTMTLFNDALNALERVDQLLEQIENELGSAFRL
jgi:division protein CdvB (Snf7/Vps24/ESCRT-III family)